MCFHAERQDEVAVVQDSVIKSQHSIINCQRESECGKIATKIGHLSEHEGIQSENGYADESADNSSIQGERPRSPVPSVVSMKSDKSMGLPPNFSGEVQQHIKIHLDRPNSPGSMLDSEEDLQDFYIASEMTDGGEEVLCAVCTKRAGKFCLTCVAHFCEIHVRQHYTAPALQRHRLVGVTDWDRHLCDLHHRALEFFCQTDQVSICACCAVDDHRQHDVVQQGGHKSVQRKKTQIPPNIDIPPPGQVSIAAVKPEAVFLKWVNPEGLSGPLKFRVSWRCRLNTHHRFIDVKNSEVQIQGLIPGEEYAFTVATLSSDGGHSFGVSITASTEVPPPKNLTVETKVTSVSVNWKKPAGVAEVSYLLTLSRDEEHQTLHTDSEEHIFNHLKLEMEYSISVLTALSTGAQSKPVFKVISTCIPIPGNLEVGSVTAASASLSWSMPSEMDEIPHSFLVSYHSKATEPQTISTDTCSAVLTGLTPDSEHSVSICTKLQDGRQGQPAVTSFQTGIPSPEMVEFTSVQPHAVALRWEPPKGLAGLYRYKVSWRGGGMLKSLKVSTRNVEARGLAPGEKYEFTVATLCDDDRQSPHAVATVRTEIPVPEHVRVESNTTSLSVKWEKPGGLKEVSYQLTLSRNEECQAISTDSLEHCFSALSPGTKYSVSVSTVLNDCQSKPVWNTTCTTIPVPEELVVDSVTLTSATISWSVPSVMDQTPHSFLISYHSEGAEPTDITTDAYNNVITGLKPGIEYMVCVCVVCENTGKGQPASTSINIGIPIPEKIEVGSVTAASASLSWSMPSEMDEIPHSFLVSYHSKGTEPQTISTYTCSAVITGLTPDSEHSVSICAKLQDGRQGQPAVTSFQTAVLVPECLTVDSLTEESEHSWSAALSWRLSPAMDRTAHSFQISYHCEGLVPQTVSSHECNTVITGLRPDAKYTADVCTVFPEGKKSANASITFYTRELRIVLLGKTETGKSSTGNTILGKDVFGTQSLTSPEMLEGGPDLTPPILTSEIMEEAAALPRDQMEPVENVTLETYFESHRTTGQESVSCEICQKSAVKSCLVCVSSYCEEHVKKHLTLPKLKKHKLVAPSGGLEEDDWEEHQEEQDVYQKLVHLQIEESETASSKAVLVPESLTVKSLTEECEHSWSAELSWRLSRAMGRTPHSFRISYHCEGLVPQTISSPECNTVITGLRPDTEYTADVCTVFPEGEKSANASVTFYTCELRIVLLGKTGSGKSSTGNTILGEAAFGVGTCSKSETDECKAKSKTIRGRQIKIVDTPGLFDTNISEKQLFSEITVCITECSPGPHAFVFLLKVEKYTVQEQENVKKIRKLFGSEALKHTVLLFTQGDQLGEGQTIEDFVKGSSRGQGSQTHSKGNQSDEGQTIQNSAEGTSQGSAKNSLKDLVDDCGGRYHVIDNKYWNQEHEYRSNNVQVERLLHTVEEMVGKAGGCYTNEFLSLVEESIKVEMVKIGSNKYASPSRTLVRQRARKTVQHRILANRAAGITSGVLIGGLLGPFIAVASAVGLLAGGVVAVTKQIVRGTQGAGPAYTNLTKSTVSTAETKATAIAGVGATGTGIATGVTFALEAGAVAVVGCGIAAGAMAGACAVAGATKGGVMGADKIKAAKSKSIGEAILQSSKQTLEENIDIVKRAYTCPSETYDQE